MTSTDTTEGPARRATIDDVAAGAGVSVATVSRALRGLPNVAESTRQRVSQVASQLSYHPDPAAARLAAGRTGTVTVAVPSLNGWYYSTVVAGAEAACAEAGLDFQVIGISNPQQRDRLLDETHRIERRTDGLIVVDIEVTDEQAASLRRRQVGLATIGSRIAGHPSIAIDDHRVGEIAAAHLLELGHRRIALIGAAADGSLRSRVPDDRRHSFRAALSRGGVELADDLVVAGHFGVAGGHEAMSVLLAARPRPTAVWAISDEMAFGALMALHEESLVPGVDVSLMGVDDHEFSRVVELTTIHQPVAEHGSSAARLVIESMTETQRLVFGDSPAPCAGHRSPSVSLVVRSTTGPPPATA